MDFFRAVNTDNASTVQTLLQQGFDPNTLNPAGQTPLYLAIKDESPKVVAVLLASPQLKPDLANAAGETPLMMAALRGQLEWTQQLAALGAKLNREGWTPLHYAATGPNPKVVAFLLDQGAAINAIAPNGSSALMMAARYGPEDTVRLLLARGADKRVRNSLNQTALDLARKADRDYLVPLLQ
ncbi:MAG TPA: ankyrin repeat domain-containing protein [Rubrivivax sp.]|nr:ankyrin repeat domain-containing protein [Rubrivivax sp.]HRY86956.1 ankyrin repeat domain-containing protein [Rubrivivax sp.]HRZ59674.1 ankyrin repeat domain-containing protein [Rubrivivax sp.]